MRPREGGLTSPSIHPNIVYIMFKRSELSCPWDKDPHDPHGLEELVVRFFPWQLAIPQDPHTLKNLFVYFFPGQLEIPHDPHTLEQLIVRFFPGQLATPHDPHTLEELFVRFFPGQLAIPPWPTCTWEALKLVSSRVGWHGVETGSTERSNDVSQSR